MCAVQQVSPNDIVFTMIGLNDWCTWASKLLLRISGQALGFIKNIFGQMMRRVGIGTSFGPSSTEKDLFKYAGFGDLEGVERVLALDKGAVSGGKMYACINVSMYQ